MKNIISLYVVVAAICIGLFAFGADTEDALNYNQAAMTFAGVRERMGAKEDALHSEIVTTCPVAAPQALSRVVTEALLGQLLGQIKLGKLVSVGDLNTLAGGVIGVRAGSAEVRCLTALALFHENHPETWAIVARGSEPLAQFVELIEAARQGLDE